MHPQESFLILQKDQELNREVCIRTLGTVEQVQGEMCYEIRQQELKSVVFLSAERLQMTTRTFVTNSGPRIKEQ